MDELVINNSMYNAYLAPYLQFFTGGTVIKVNVPEITQTLPMNDETHVTSVSSGCIVNTNFPSINGTMTASHCISVKMTDTLSSVLEHYRGNRYLLLNTTGILNEATLMLP